jgi:hypothetical protein
MTDPTPVPPAPPVPINPATSGFAIAALVLSLVGGAILGVVFGILALNDIKKTGKQGRGMAIAGIVIGAVASVAWIFFWIAMAVAANSIEDYDYTPSDFGDTSTYVPPAVPADPGDAAVDTLLSDLYGQCADGDMAACDSLYFAAPMGSEQEAFGQTCGGREPAGYLELCDK